MSNTSQHQIACPFCGQEQEVELWDVIDVDEEPGLREQMLTNRINRVECAGCRKGFRIDKPVVYRHLDEDILIHCDPLTGRRVHPWC